ncbi:MgtC/SapB family protein, partial [Carnobacterium sp.]|uniref:MgtC/SapB family protein n=1 Tax=Carnobacterium sp. TaxID=48221 RepID=UPI0028ADC9BB
LGAGTILHLKNNIVGLTTAASMWAVAVAGLATGMGYYVIAIGGCFIIVGTLNTVNKFQKKYITKIREIQLDIYFQSDKKVIGDVLSALSKYNVEIEKVEFVELNTNEMNHIKYFIHLPGNLNIDLLKKELYYVNQNITKVTQYGF